MTSSSTYNLTFPQGWVSAAVLEYNLTRAGEPHLPGIAVAIITLPVGSKVMVDAAARLLSLANQLAHRGCQVTIDFQEGEGGVMGYLNRLGFLDLLHPSIEILPQRPIASTAQIYEGTNPGVVEFMRLHPSNRNQETPSRLADALEHACINRADRKKLGQAAFTIFAELIDNTYEHSDTEIDGYAALQVHNNGGNALVVVSDSGHGLLETIRPSLIGSPLAALSDPELIVYMLNEGVSRFGDERGAGLRQCAEQALKYKAELYLRLPTASLKLLPASQGYKHNRAFGTTGLPRYGGTHLAFRFRLDNSL